MKILATVTGLDDLTRALDKLGGAARGDVAEKAVGAGGLVLEGAMKETIEQLGLVDTGAMMNSVEMETRQDSQGAEALVGPTVEYAIYHELGTQHMDATPFARPALDEHEDEIVGAVADVLRRELGGWL